MSRGHHHPPTPTHTPRRMHVQMLEGHFTTFPIYHQDKFQADEGSFRHLPLFKHTGIVSSCMSPKRHPSWRKLTFFDKPKPDMMKSWSDIIASSRSKILEQPPSTMHMPPRQPEFQPAPPATTSSSK